MYQHSTDGTDGAITIQNERLFKKKTQMAQIKQIKTVQKKFSKSFKNNLALSEGIVTWKRT